MKTIGLLGGTSWVSTAEYNRYLHMEIAASLGGLNSARLVTVHINFAELEPLMKAGLWDNAAEMLAEAARPLHGTDVILLCSNLVHKMYDAIQERVSVPILHIGDAIGEEIRAKGYRTVALLGAKPTMEENFYKARIEAISGATVIIPDAPERDYIDEAIFKRLCQKVFTREDKQAFLDIVEELKRRGAEAVILGCTEFPILLQEASVPLINSTELHSMAAIDLVFQGHALRHKTHCKLETDLPGYS